MADNALKQFYQDLQNGHIAPVYLFYGEEALLMDEALAALAQAVDPQDLPWSREILDGEETNPEIAAAACMAGSLFGGKRLVLVKNIAWEDSSAVVNYLQDPHPDTCLALTMRAAPDKRRKLAQTIQKKGRLIECATPKGGEKDRWLVERCKAAGLQVERQAIAYISVSTANLSQMAAEVEKLRLFVGERGQITLADAENVVAKSSLLTIFELTDAAAAQNAAAAMACYRQLRRQGEEEQKIFVMLAAQFRNMLLTQDLLAQGKRAADIAAALSLHPFVVEKCSRACRGFSRRQLIRALEILLSADIAQKSGQGEMDNMLEISVLRICAM